METRLIEIGDVAGRLGLSVPKGRGSTGCRSPPTCHADGRRERKGSEKRGRPLLHSPSSFGNRRACIAAPAALWITGASRRSRRPRRPTPTPKAGPW